ncbi:Inosose dehydratase, partial [Dysosmobacter welbionis]
RCGGQAQGKFRREVGQDLLVCIGGGVVGLVHYDVAEVIRLEPLQVQRHALDAAAHHKGVALLHTLHIAAHRGPGPQLPEGLGGLIHQLHRVSQKQRTLAKALSVHDGGHRLAGAGGMIEQGDGLEAAAHLLQSRQGLLLVFLQFQFGTVQGLAPLGGEIVLNFLEVGMLAQEYPQLVFDGLRLLLHLPHRPAVHIPTQVDHAVLLEQVVVKFVLGDQLGVVRGFVIDLDGHLPPAVFDQKVGKPAVLVDVGEGILGIEITGFLGAEGVGEQFNEQVLGTAAGGGAVGWHGDHLGFLL